MLASCTTSKCAAWDTIGSDDSEMMWSQTPDKVLHWMVGGRGGAGGWREKAVTWMKRAIVASVSRGERTHHMQDFVLGFIYGAVLGGILRKAQLPLEKCVQNWVIIGISAVGGYKQKSSSLAPITRHTPTQTCTNTKQMNHQCGGTSPSLSLSLPVFR